MKYVLILLLLTGCDVHVKASVLIDGSCDTHGGIKSLHFSDSKVISGECMDNFKYTVEKK